MLLGAAALLWSVAALAAAQTGSEPASADNEQIVREFVAAWSRLDADELVAYFTEDGTYFNMPTAPVTGRDNLRAFIAGFLEPWDETEWEIVNLLAEGNIVMVERMDRTVVSGRPVALPCFGIFEMENGKIKVWRDYFDLATFTSALAPPQPTR
jgi:limonene-1,2-epoxide hydrolase